MTLDNIILLDSSALMAFFKGEPGQHIVAPILKNSAMSAINLAECYYLLRKSMDEFEVQEVLSIIRTVINTTRDHAHKAGELFYNSRNLGLSIADCVCLTLAKDLNIKVMTADKQWLKLSEQLGLDIIAIR